MKRTFISGVALAVISLISFQNNRAGPAKTKDVFSTANFSLIKDTVPKKKKKYNYFRVPKRVFLIK